MIINRIYETQNLLSLQFVSFLVGLRTYQHPCIYTGLLISPQPDLLHDVFCLMVRIFRLMLFLLYIYIYIYIYIIPPIMIINRIYETQNLLSLQLVSFLVWLRIYQHPRYYTALYYTASTCFDATASSSGSSQSVPVKLHKYAYAVTYQVLTTSCLKMT